MYMTYGHALYINAGVINTHTHTCTRYSTDYAEPDQWNLNLELLLLDRRYTEYYTEQFLLI